MRVVQGRPLVVMAILVCEPAPGLAQRTHGYFFVAPGRSPDGYTEHIGIGGELALPKRFGAGLELGLHGQAKGLTHVRNVFFLASLNGYFHFPLSDPNTTWDPFVTAGYSSAETICVFSCRSANLFNFGTGANYWFARHFGFRAELRDHVGNFYGGPAGHYWGVRFALTFR